MTRLVIALRVLVVVLAIASARCSPSPEMLLFNNTAASIRVVPSPGEGCEAKPGEACTFQYADYFTLAIEGRERRYAFPDGLNFENRREWVEFQPVSRRIIKLQLDDDGRIFIVPATTKGRQVTPYPIQREGFPLLPLHRSPAS